MVCINIFAEFDYIAGMKYRSWKTSPDVATPTTHGIIISLNLFLILLQQPIIENFTNEYAIVMYDYHDQSAKLIRM